VLFGSADAAQLPFELLESVEAGNSVTFGHPMTLRVGVDSSLEAGEWRVVTDEQARRWNLPEGVAVKDQHGNDAMGFRFTTYGCRQRGEPLSAFMQSVSTAAQELVECAVEKWSGEKGVIAIQATLDPYE
jgi:hypothetical protein